MTTEDALLRAALEAPADGLAKLALADWYEEHGRPGLAHAWRWAARRGRHPHVSPAGKSVRWQRGTRDRRGACNLPGPVFDLLRGERRGSVVRVYRSAPAAFEALAVALGKLRALWEVTP